MFNKLIQKRSLKIEIKKTLLIKIRNLNIEEYNICEYIIIFIYILYENDIIILIRRKIYIVNNLFVKSLINIDIIKSKNIIFNINKDFIIIKLYIFLRIKIFIIIKSLKINVITINKIRYIVLIYLFLIIFIEYIDLLIKRNFVFKLN